MAYDPVRNLTVFVGPDTQSQWAWNGTNWSSVSAGGPGDRFSFGMVYDEDSQRIMAFGGDAGSGLLADTWEWNGTTWSQPAPQSVSPAQRG
jgi:hypothetical protein